jgi:Skp family chaperone for outer membrane proteins
MQETIIECIVLSFLFFHPHLETFRRRVFMRAFIAICILLLPASVFAQPPQNMGNVDVQKMMQQAQEMQVCIGNVDQTELQKFQQRAMEVNKEIKSLCAAGKRDKAQNLAIDFAKEAAENSAMQEMKKCGELAKGMMPETPEQEDKETDYSKQHVCDNLGELDN